MKKILSLLALAVLTIGLLGSCKKSTPVSGVSLDKATLELTEGDTEVLTPTIFPVEADNKNVSWSSDKTDVATVDQSGKVTAVVPGTANITVTTEDGLKTATCAVTVKAAKVPVTDVTLDKTELEITVGDADVKLTATVAPENATDKTVSWSSDKTDVATVDQEGNVHALAEGTATITVTTTDGGKTATCAVTVKAAKVPVTDVTLDKTELEITVGDADVKLTATVAPENATDKTVSWSSDKTDVATVDQEGNVHALAEGTATITVTTTDGGKTATCAVTVKAAIPEGALSGGFSVSATKKVHFSKGNLVATIDASGAPTAWKFAANQYDYLENGGAKLTIGSAAGDVDLFGWSTPGTTYGISNSNNDSDYSGDFVDWGKAIGDGNTWHTPSKEEWTYLTNNDGADNVRKGKYKYGVTVCEKTNCLILAPDDFTGEIATSYDAAAWASAEAAGLVCLPAAGYSDRAEIRGVGTSGYYWSSSPFASGRSYYMQIRGGSGRSSGEINRDNGFSVRLITDVK